MVPDAHSAQDSRDFSPLSKQSNRCCRSEMLIVWTLYPVMVQENRRCGSPGESGWIRLLDHLATLKLADSARADQRAALRWGRTGGERQDKDGIEEKV